MNELIDAACEDPVRAVLPFVANGRAAPHELEAARRHIEQCASCRAEFEWERSLVQRMRTTSSVDYAPGAALSRFMDRLDAPPAKSLDGPQLAVSSTTASPGARRARARGWRGAFTSRRGLAWAAIGQSVALVALVGLFVTRAPAPAPAGYATLSQPAAAVPVPGVRLVVAPTLSLAEFATLVRGIDAQIVSGPTAAGVYTLAVASPHGDVATAIDAALVRLRADPRVLFAEPVARPATAVAP
jgi:hypothetical protein